MNIVIEHHYPKNHKHGPECREKCPLTYFKIRIDEVEIPDPHSFNIKDPKLYDQSGSIEVSLRYVLDRRTDTLEELSIEHDRAVDRLLAVEQAAQEVIEHYEGSLYTEVGRRIKWLAQILYGDSWQHK